MAEETRRIRLHLYDRELSVNAKASDEEYYRSAAKMISDKVNTYASIFRGKKDDKDILYMAMLDIAFRFEKESSSNDTKPFTDILGKLTTEIEDALKPQK
jgi:cell division protein ZapA